jgi:hypothetical protein
MSVRPIFLPYPGARLKFFFFPILRPATKANRGREGLKPPYDSLARISLWSPFSNFTHVLWYIRPTSRHFRLSPTKEPYPAMSHPVPIRHWLLPARHCLPRPRVVSRCPILILSPTLPIFCRLRDSTSPVGRSILVLPPLVPPVSQAQLRAQAGAGRREAHTAHTAGHGDTKLEGEPRAPSSTASGGHQLTSNAAGTNERFFLKKIHEQRRRNQRAIFF